MIPRYLKSDITSSFFSPSIKTSGWWVSEDSCVEKLTVLSCENVATESRVGVLSLPSISSLHSFIFFIYIFSPSGLESTWVKWSFGLRADVATDWYNLVVAWSSLLHGEVRVEAEPQGCAPGNWWDSVPCWRTLERITQWRSFKMIITGSLVWPQAHAAPSWVRSRYLNHFILYYCIYRKCPCQLQLNQM